MHPRAFLDGLWRNELRDEVFVAMSFDERFDERWERILRPAIQDQVINGSSLTAVRVDIRRSGDSILTEIVDGIAHASLVLADVSVTDRFDVGDGEASFRNGNVLYEVGLALACRQPVEVVLVRDDSDKLLFDLSHIPVLTFDPADVDGSVESIRKVLKDRMRERVLVKDMRVVRTLESLSTFEMNVIRSNAHLNVFGWKGPSLPAAVAMALPALLKKGILRLHAPARNEGPGRYVWTPFGKAIAEKLAPASADAAEGKAT